MRIRAFFPASGKAVVPWLLEGLLIVVSVALGFWVTQVQQGRQDRELAARVLERIEQEIVSNAKTLEPYVAMHDTWLGGLTNAQSDVDGQSQSAFDVWMNSRPPFPPGAPSPFAFLRRSAWDTALSAGIIRMIDPDRAASLSELYRAQEIATQNVERLANGVLTSSNLYDPADRRASVRLLWLTLADIQSAEVVLRDAYKEQLPKLRAVNGR
jgi:hypothetical protein